MAVQVNFAFQGRKLAIDVLNLEEFDARSRAFFRLRREVLSGDFRDGRVWGINMQEAVSKSISQSVRKEFVEEKFRGGSPNDSSVSVQRWERSYQLDGNQTTFFGHDEKKRRKKKNPKALRESGRLRAAWSSAGGTADSVREPGKSRVLYGVKNIPYAEIHRGGRIGGTPRKKTTIPVTDRMFFNLGGTFGLWLTQSTRSRGIVIPSRPHGYLNADIRQAAQDIYSTGMVTAFAKLSTGRGIKVGRAPRL